MTQVKRVEDAKLDKVVCFRIEAKYDFGRSETLWIDQEKFLIWRSDVQDKFDDFRTEQTTTYYPVIDDEIPDMELEFDPPKQK